MSPYEPQQGQSEESSVLGMVEFLSIARGILASDAMVKAAPITMLSSHPIDPGRYLSVITGDLASVEASVKAGFDAAGSDYTVYQFVLANLHTQVFKALQGLAPTPKRDAVGIVETFSAASIVKATDAACKAAPVELATLHLALRLGGKGYAVIVGDIADVEASVDAGVREAGATLYQSAIVPNPYEDIYVHLLARDRGCYSGWVESERA